jgi:hypothetical protein
MQRPYTSNSCPKSFRQQAGSAEDFGEQYGAKCLNVPNDAVKTPWISLNCRLGAIKEDSRSRGRYNKVFIIVSSFRRAS